MTGGKEPEVGCVGYSFKNFIQGPGGTSPELRVHTALAKDQNLVPRTLRLSPGPGALTPPSGLHRLQHSYAHPLSAVRVVVSLKTQLCYMNMVLF